MKHYEVMISDKANEDMEEIYRYISEKLYEPALAAKQYDRIAEAIITLEEMPKRIRIMDSEQERLKRLRRLNVDNYSVFFVIKDDCVHIARVLYGASDIGKRLSNE